MAVAARIRWYVSVGVVALVFLCGSVLPLEAEGRPPDLVIVHGRVEASGIPQALAIRDGLILCLGQDAEIRAQAGPRTRVVDAAGGSVLPGFNDSHVHMLSGGMGLRGIALQGLGSLAQIQQRLREAAQREPGKGWLVGRGWTYDVFGGRLPTRAELDVVVSDRPVYLRAFDGHTGWANTMALQRAGIVATTPDPPGGTIVRDPATKLPTGVVKESAEDLVQGVIPAPTFAARQDALRAALREAHRVGVTSVGEAGVTFDEMTVFESLRDRGELRLRTYVALSLDHPDADAELARADEIRRRHRDDPFLRVGAMKLFIDGVIESHTARLLAPYADQPGMRAPLMDQATLDRTIAGLARRGWQVWVHAIGDGGVRMVLDALEHAAAGKPSGYNASGPRMGQSSAGNLEIIRAGRHRIEHAEIIDPADLPRLAHLGVIASQQPLHGSPDGVDSWCKALGLPRAARGWAHASIHASGARLTFGSDWPVVGLDPLPALRIAVTRSASGKAWTPQERIPLAVALAAYTEGGAFASFAEQRQGRLAPGQWGDVVILSRDIHAGETPWDARAVVTIVGGQVVYEDASRAPSPLRAPSGR